MAYDDGMMPFFKLSSTLKSFLQEPKRTSDISDLQALLRKHLPDLLNPLQYAGLNADDRKKIQSGRVTLGNQQVPIPESIQKEILAMADELQLNEMACLHIWAHVSESSVRRHLEQVASRPIGSLGDDIPAAAREMHYFERMCLLGTICELLKARMDLVLVEAKQEIISSFANQLLIDGLPLKLMEALRTTVSKFGSQDRVTPFIISSGLKLAECLFFLYYSVQIEAEEVKTLVGLLQHASSLVSKTQNLAELSGPEAGFQTSLTSAHPPGRVSQGTGRHDVVELSQILYVLQLSVLCSLDQNHGLIDRRTNQVNPMGPGNWLSEGPDKSIVDQLHELIFTRSWEHKGYQGITLLAWSVFLLRSSLSSPAVDHSSRPTALNNIKDVLKAVLQKRTFGFIAGPFLSSRKLEALPFYVGVLEDVVFSYLVDNAEDLPPPRVQLRLDESAARTFLSSTSNSSSVSPSQDSLEDIIQSIIEICAANPRTATKFWDQESDDFTTLQSFLKLVLQQVQQQHEHGLHVAYYKLLCTLAAGPGCADHVFSFVRNSPSRHSWDYFFNVFKQYEMQMRPPGSSIPSIYEATAPAGPSPKEMSPQEVQALEAIFWLIQAVVRVPSISTVFTKHRTWATIPTLLGLLRCPVPSVLKGAIMRTLAVLGRAPENALQIWQELEGIQILPTYTPVVGENSQRQHPVKFGIRYELEQMESYERTYPATRGFIALMNELVEVGCPSALGTGYRVPGVHPYLSFLKDEVLVKFDARAYRDPAEKWEVATGVLSVLHKILSKYTVPSSTGDKADLKDFTEEWVEFPGVTGHRPAPRSVGFELLRQMLIEGPLLKTVLDIISHDGGVHSLVKELESPLFPKGVLESGWWTGRSAAPLGQRKNEAVNNLRPSILRKAAYWRERAVFFCLQLLESTLEREEAFISLVRLNLPQLQVEPLHGLLMRARKSLVAALLFVRHTPTVSVSLIAVRLLYQLSYQVVPRDIVAAIRDEGAADDLVDGFVQQLMREDWELLQGDDPATELRESLLVDYENPRLTAAVSAEDQQQIRTIIVDLLLDNLSVPRQDLAFLLLGLSDAMAGDGRTAAGLVDIVSKDAATNCLTAILILLSLPGFGQGHPELAERCHELIYRLCAHPTSAIPTLECLRHPQYDFFLSQLQQMLSYPTSYYSAASPIVSIAQKNIRAWVLKGLALDLHMAAKADPPQWNKTSRLLSFLFTARKAGKSSTELSRMVILELLDATQLDFSAPEPLPSPQIGRVAEECSKVVDLGSQSFVRIDIQAFHQALLKLWQSQERASSIMSSSRNFGDSSEGLERPLKWAVEWNTYVDCLAAETHSVEAWCRVVDVALVECLPILERQILAPQTADRIGGQEDLLFTLLDGILQKLCLPPGIAPELAQSLSGCVLMLMAALRERQGALGHIPSAQQCASLLSRLVDSIKRQTNGKQGPGQQARGLLYASLLHYLRYTEAFEERGDPERAGFGDMPDELISVNQRMLRACGNDFLLALAADSTGGSEVWRSVVMSVFDSLMPYCGPAALQILSTRGHIQVMLNIFKRLSDIGEASVSTPSVRLLDALYESTLSLLNRIAQTAEGASLLVEYGAIEAATGCKPVLRRPPSVSARAMATGYGAAEWQPVDRFHRLWVPLSQLILSLLTALPKHKLLAGQVFTFINVHHKAFGAILKDREETLQSLQELAIASAILHRMAAFPIDFTEKLGELSGKYTTAMAQLLLKYGLNSLPPSSNRMELSDRRTPDTWWTKVIPQKDVERRRAEIQVSSLIGGDAPWNLFDIDKLSLCLDVLGNAAAFTRTKLQASIALGAPGDVIFSPPKSATDARKVVMDTMGDFELSFANVCIALTRSSEMVQAIARTNLKDPAAAVARDSFLSSARFVSENLLAVLVDHVRIYLSKTSAMSSTVSVEALGVLCSMIAEPLKPLDTDNSFVHSLLRKIKELLRPDSNFP